MAIEQVYTINDVKTLSRYVAQLTYIDSRCGTREIDEQESIQKTKSGIEKKISDRFGDDVLQRVTQEISKLSGWI